MTRVVPSALLATPLLLSTSPDLAFAAYYDACQSAGYQQNFAVMTQVDATRDISGSLADVDMRALHPCTQNGTFADQTGVVVSIQYNETNQNRLVQIGFTRCSDSSGCNDIPGDGDNHFWYTKFDDGGGQAYLADGWYKAPINGHRYRMKVEATTNNGDSVWQYCIKDLTAAEGYVCKFRSRTWTYGLIAWWGTENHNIHSQNGTRYANPALDLEAQFKQSGTWYWREGSGNVCFEPGNSPSYYGCSVLWPEYRTFWSYTFDH